MSLNSTLNRKPGNDMKKNAGSSTEPRRSNQSNESALAASGMAGDGVNRAANPYAGNQSGLTMKERYASGPRKGNASSSGMDIGPSVTKDPHKLTIATAAGGKIDGGTGVKGFKNPDAINVGMK